MKKDRVLSNETENSTCANAMLAVVFPRKLVHSGKKRAYPSSFVWDCLKCGKWNIWQTRRLFGVVKVCCQECRENYNLDKSKPLEEITRTKDMKSIID
jgi:hypothetical protein